MRPRSVRFFVCLTGLLDGDYALLGMRGGLMAGLVVVHLLRFPGESACRSSCRLREAYSLRIESLGVPG